MLPRNHPDRIKIAFDDHSLVANAGLILPATLALHLGLSQLVQKHLDPGDAPSQANTGDKVMTLVASALAGGDCIDDDVLRTGGRPSPSAAWSRPHPPWVLSCAASVGGPRPPTGGRPVTGESTPMPGLRATRKPTSSTSTF